MMARAEGGRGKMTHRVPNCTTIPGLSVSGEYNSLTVSLTSTEDWLCLWLYVRYLMMP